MTVDSGFTGGHADPSSVQGIYTTQACGSLPHRVGLPPGRARIQLTASAPPPSHSHPGQECGPGPGTHAVPFCDLPGSRLSLIAFFHFTANGFKNAACHLSRVSPQRVGRAWARAGGAVLPPQHPKRPVGWKSFPVPAILLLLWLSAGKSGTSQPPSGNRRDTNRSFKTQNIWSVTFSIWANRALLITPREKASRAEGGLNGYRMALGWRGSPGNSTCTKDNNWADPFL